MNIQQAVQQASEQLSPSSPSAQLDAQLLLTFVLQCNQTHLFAWPDKALKAEAAKRYFDLVQQRSLGHPVAHLTGTREFWSLDFFVDGSTLIPRPETETLVEFTLEKFSTNKPLKVLDMGTGTGAIAISLASEKPHWQLIASDISEQALQLASKNKKRHQISNLTLRQSDWFNNISECDFDIIISNPPYIAIDDSHLSNGDVRFEPESALTSGKTGMDDIEHLCAYAKHHLSDNGWLIIEHGYDQQQAVFNCFTNNGFAEIEQQKDLSGITRMTAGKRKF